METDGWRYEDLPEDSQAWRDTLRDLDDDAQARFGCEFAQCKPAEQRTVIQAVQDAGSGGWHGLNAARVWSLWTRYACTAFYSHPRAWNEIGFPGPAYPRGTSTRASTRREPFEVPDVRPGADPIREGYRWPTSATATSRRGCCRTTAPAPTTGCATTCVGSPTTDEVDLAVVGCGAGGSTLLQRLARRGWRVVALDAGPFWDPDARLGQRRGRVAPSLLDRAAGDRGRRPGAAGLQQLRPRRRRVDGALRRLRPGSIRATSPPGRTTASARTGRSAMPSCGPTTATSRKSCRSPASTGRGAIRTATRSGRTPSAATARCSCAAPTGPGIAAKVGPVAISNGRFGNRPHCIYRGFCLQGCKVNAKASPLITHIPDALAHGAEVRANCHGDQRRGGRAHRPGDRRALCPGRGPRGSSGPPRSPSPGTPSRRRGCC